MNERNKNRVLEKLRNIQANDFDVDDLEIMLMNIREYARVKGYTLLEEICNFVAHPDRDKGVVYEEVDILYSQFKYMPTQAGDNLDYYNIDKVVFALLFDKGLDQLADDFLLAKFRKNRLQLKNHIRQVLVKKEGSVFQARSEGFKNQLRNIQNVCFQIPQIRKLTEDKLYTEIKTCLKMMAAEAHVRLDLTTLDLVRDNLILCILELIQSCTIILHDGNTAQGSISVGTNNTLYDQYPSLANLNMSFTVTIPVEQSFVSFELLTTRLTVGKHIPNLSTIIEWKKSDYSFGRLNAFRIGKAGMIDSM